VRPALLLVTALTALMMACSDDGGPAAECDLTPDCDPGHVCIDQRCWQAVSCATDADCNGFVCDNGACVEGGSDASGVDG